MALFNYVVLPELNSLQNFYGHIDTYANNAAGVNQDGSVASKQNAKTEEFASNGFYGQ